MTDTTSLSELMVYTKEEYALLLVFLYAKFNGRSTENADNRNTATQYIDYYDYYALADYVASKIVGYPISDRKVPPGVYGVQLPLEDVPRLAGTKSVLEDIVMKWRFQIGR